MSYGFRVTQRLLALIHADLSRPHPFAHERVGFICCRIGKSRERSVILGESYQRVEDDDYMKSNEVGALMGPSHYAAGWHSTGTYGTFGAAMAAATLLGLDDEQLLHCFGLAGTQAAGLEQPIAHRAQQRSGAFNRLPVIATDHDGQSSLRRPRDTPGHRGIEQHDVACGQRRSQLAGAGGIRRTHVDRDGAAAQLVGQALAQV